MENIRRLKIMLVDDQPFVREGLRMYLALQNGVSIVGEAKNGTEAIEQAFLLKPDLILMDVEMAGSTVNGLAAVKTIKTQLPEIFIIVLTIHDDKNHRAEAKKAGADLFLSKDRLETLGEIIRKMVQKG